MTDEELQNEKQESVIRLMQKIAEGSPVAGIVAAMPRKELESLACLTIAATGSIVEPGAKTKMTGVLWARLIELVLRHYEEKAMQEPIGNKIQ